ncbi:MAG: metallophosphoesterase [Nanoarchaeota archaeon]|nr:metallophosphoesterase [Nanoarchaeota archaeon]
MIKTLSKDIVVISDVHAAYNWDNVAIAVKGIANFLNPNNELRKVIKKLNRSSGVGAVVFNGDAIDNFYADYLNFTDFFGKLKKKRKNNWDLFNKSVGNLKKKYFQIPGNHEYRLESYNYRFWSRLVAFNIPDKIRKKVAKKIGHHNHRWWFELKSVLLKKRFKYLKKYKGLICPAFKQFDGYNMIFLNTRYDVVARMRNWWKLFKSFFRKGYFFTDAQGLRTKDIRFVRQTLADNEDDTFHIFMHVPIINSCYSRINEEYRLDLSNFRDSIAEQGLDHEVCLDNSGRFLKTLKRSKKNIILVTSHVHDSKYFLIDKKTMKAKEVSLKHFNRKRNNPIYIKHLTTLSLGNFSPYDPYKRTGYLRISNKGFKEVVVHKFAPKGKKKYNFEWSFFNFIKELFYSG